jgi:hypothetical protein
VHSRNWNSCCFSKEVGVKTEVVGVFTGAFSVALGFWISRIMKRNFPLKTLILIFFSFSLTIFPLKPLFNELGLLKIPFFNLDYFYDKFILGSVIGGVLMVISPPLSRNITQRRGKSFPFQTLLITFALLILTSLLFQFS